MLDFGRIHKWIALRYFPTGLDVWIYNGAGVWFDDKFLYACRARNMSNNGRSHVIIQYFRASDYAPISMPRGLPLICDDIPGVDPGPQDPRCFRLNGDLCLVFNQLRSDGFRRMHLYNITTGGGSRQLRIAQRAEKKVEKNWTPFVMHGKLFLIYLFAPLVILDCNVDNGQCQVAFADSTGKHNLLMRGGSPAVETAVGTFTGYLHSVKPLPHNHQFNRDNLPLPARNTPFVYRAHRFILKVDEATGKWSVEIQDEEKFFPERQIEQIYAWSPEKAILNVDDKYTLLVDMTEK